MATGVPQPTIYLRNQFTLKANRQTDFLIGKENLLRNARGWTLVAGCGERLLLKDDVLPEPSLPMLQVWRLDQWDTLYNSVYEFSETGWYRTLGDSLDGEDQELLVGVLGGDSVSVAPTWISDDEPGYVYVYEEALPGAGQTHTYLRELHWLTAQLAQYGWQRVWTASQITAAPSLVSLLWKVAPADLGGIERTLGILSNQKPYAMRYQRLFQSLKAFSRRCYYPIYSERLAQRIRKDPTIGPLIEKN